MRIRVLYFAAVRDLLTKSEEELEVADGATIETLARLLEERHELLRGRLANVRFARNETFSAKDEPIAAGDTIALIPPVSGG